MSFRRIEGNRAEAERIGLGKSRYIPLKEKLAAVLRDLMVEVDGKLVRAIPYDVAKGMTADEVIAKFHFDHGIYHVLDGPGEHWNLTPRLVGEHREKTAEIDIPAIAKTKRIAKKEAAFRERMLQKRAPTVQETVTPAKKIKSRGFSRPRDGYVYDWSSGRYVAAGSIEKPTKRGKADGR